jgi:peptide/nickel transport system permease protein
VLRLTVERLVETLITAWLVASISFVLVRSLPGDPAAAMAGPDATAEEIAALRTHLRLDEPMHFQYVRFLARLCRADLGISIQTRRPVLAELARRFPATLELALAALGTAIVVGIPLGILTAMRRGSWFDRCTRIGSLVGVGLPTFWLAIVLVWLFAFQLRLLPVAGRLDVRLDVPQRTGFVLIDAFVAGDGAAALDALQHLLLPALTLAAAPIAILSRLMRGGLVEILQEDYIRTARAKGLAERTVVLRHAAKGALQPVVTILGLQLATLLAGAVLVESVFAWPGVGNYVYTAIQIRDYPVVQGAVVMVALVYILINNLVDLSYAYLDPRVRAPRSATS